MTRRRSPLPVRPERRPEQEAPTPILPVRPERRPEHPRGPQSKGAAALAFTLAVLCAGCPDDPACAPGWDALADDLDRVPLAVQGTAADDVWVVGGGLGLGGPLLTRWDGAAWRAIDPAGAIDAARSLWWVWPEARARAWVVGEAGTVAHVDATTTPPTVTDRSTATAATLYGVWGSGPDDVWLVGGIANGRRDPEDDLVWRWDGARLAAVPGVPSRGATLFKVWGAGPDDVWISGEGGTMLHWDGAAFTDHSRELATPSSVLTVQGCAPDDVWAIAGQGLYHFDGTGWARRTDVTIGSSSNGVSCAADRVLVVGNAGVKLSLDRATGQWTDDRRASPTATDLHGAWLDPAGRAWAVGGNFNQPGATSRTGVVGLDGCPRPDAF